MANGKKVTIRIVDGKMTVNGANVLASVRASNGVVHVIDGVLGSTTIPAINIPLVDVPPDVQGGGLFTMGSTKNFTQTFTGAGGQHTYTFQSGPA